MNRDLIPGAFENVVLYKLYNFDMKFRIRQFTKTHLAHIQSYLMHVVCCEMVTLNLFHRQGGTQS